MIDLGAISCSPEAMEADHLAGAAPVAEPADPWLRRRAHAFGASEAGALLILAGHRHPEDAPRWVAELARPIRVGLGGRWVQVPRLIARKAGLAAPAKRTPAMDRGIELERELFVRAVRLMVRGALRGGGGLLDPRSMRHAASVPREWLPLVDRECPRLAATPDAWARDILDRHVAVELKTNVRPIVDLPWHYRAQVLVQCSTMAAESGCLIAGQGWALPRDDGPDGPTGPLAAWDVERDEVEIERIRAAARSAWDRVEELREQRTREDDE